MVVTINDLLSPAQLDAVCSVLREGRFVDGKSSAGKDARDVKHNLELDTGSERREALDGIVMGALVRHPDYLQYAMPAKIAAPVYARYEAGMAYGGHIDDPIMGGPAARYRSDISITIFLNAPQEYAGGELCIDTGDREQTYKLPAGSALLYPSTRYHEVRPVSAGERLVAITWVQSLIRRADQRELLVQLGQARSLLAEDGDSAAYRNLNLAYTNLFRMWADV